MKTKVIYDPDKTNANNQKDGDKASQDGTLSDEALTAGDLDGGGGVGGGIAGKESQTGGSEEPADEHEQTDDDLGPITES